MLWVAHESFDDPDRKRAKYTFAIGERIYLLNASFNNGGFLVSELNPRNYELKPIPVILHDFTAPHSVYGGSLVVHEERAYLWHARAERLFVGWIEDDGCHWRVEETRGVMPSGRYGYAHCKWNNSLLIHGGFEELPAVITGDTFALDLDTKIWSMSTTVASQDILTAFSSMSRWDGCAVLGEKGRERMHVIGAKGDAHFVLDLSTNRWSSLKADGADRLPVVFNAFCACGHLYFYGFPSPQEGSVLYRLEEGAGGTAEWVQMHASGARSPRLSSLYQHVLVIGTRVFFIEGEEVERFEDGEGKASMSVLELNPNLFDQAASVLLRSDEGREIIRSILPRYLANQLVYDKLAATKRVWKEEETVEGDEGGFARGLLSEIRRQRQRRGLAQNDGVEMMQ